MLTVRDFVMGRLYLGVGVLVGGLSGLYIAATPNAVISPIVT